MRAGEDSGVGELGEEIAQGRQGHRAVRGVVRLHDRGERALAVEEREQRGLVGSHLEPGAGGGVVDARRTIGTALKGRAGGESRPCLVEGDAHEAVVAGGLIRRTEKSGTLDDGRRAEGKRRSRGGSSVGRARASQARGRGFESLPPLREKAPAFQVDAGAFGFKGPRGPAG